MNELKRIERAYYIFRLLATPKIGQAKARQIIETCKNLNMYLSDMFNAVDNGDNVPHLLEKYYETLKIKDSRIDEQWDKLNDNNVQSVIYDEDDYPKKLSNALGDKAPIILFYRGNLTFFTYPSIGFCGSRKASTKGLETAKDCADQMAGAGANIISGYAHGVDLTTHVAALESGGVTTLILAEGILNFKFKQELSNYRDFKNILIISEFLPGVPWSVRNAMQRNNTICGLSDATILIEAREKGGSLDAGNKCLSIGRPLFAPVYQGMPESASGNRLLLEKGAQELMRSKKTGRAKLTKLRQILFENNNEGLIEKLDKSNTINHKTLFQ